MVDWLDVGLYTIVGVVVLYIIIHWLMKTKELIKKKKTETEELDEMLK